MNEKRDIALQILLSMIPMAPSQQLKDLVDISIKASEYIIKETEEEVIEATEAEGD